MIFHSKLRAMMWVRVVHNEVVLSESLWWLYPLKCRSQISNYEGLQVGWRHPPKGWLKFNICGVVFEDKAGGGKVLRDEDGAARTAFSGPCEANEIELTELKSIVAALDLYDGMGWENWYPLLIEVSSLVVYNWLVGTESRSGKFLSLFADIKKRPTLSIERVEHKRNEMAYVLVI